MNLVDLVGHGPSLYSNEVFRMSVSAKCYYALRAMYALSEHGEPTPLKASEIAAQQHIPIKFWKQFSASSRGVALC